MSEILYTAATGATAQQLRLETLANNLANADTVGFKADKLSFSSLLPDPGDLRAAAVPAEGAKLTGNVHVGSGSGHTDFSQGPLHTTGNVLDLAISGDGFFTVETPAGPRYTRQGVFALSPGGVLVTAEGYPVLGDGGPITVQGQEVSVGEDGTVTVDNIPTARLRVVDFERPYRLEKVGAAMFKAADDTVVPQPARDATVAQGMVEAANVDPVRIMTEMLEVLRTYESHQKVMRTAEDLDSKLISEAGRSS
jgi:flagellar basal-body rod protein FlgG